MEKYTKEVLEEAVKNSESFAGVLRYLGLKQAGGTQCHIKKRILKYEIITSHFTGMGHYKGKSTCNKKSYDQVLKIRSEENKEKSHILRRALIESGIEHKCGVCNIKDWNKKKIVLHIHHLNGNNMDNRKINLIFHCPNCHSQTENFSGKSNKTGM